ncbi:MAG TPA: hypothetical protein PLL69_09030 [Gemmatimonadales bacterium]|nr:hypothetical protein [Gemmatimonadales bacterium]
MTRLLVTGALVALVAAPIQAQSTGTPVYSAPYRSFATSEMGLSLSDPGSGFALEGSWRTALSGSSDVGLRAGLSDRGRSTALLVGGDYRMRLLDHNEDFPLDGSLTLGLGLASGDGYTVGYLPVGFSMGRRVLVEGSQVSLVPYIHPVLAPMFGDADDLAFSMGFGLDARVSPRLDVRFSAAIGDLDGIAFTVAWLR